MKAMFSTKTKGVKYHHTLEMHWEAIIKKRIFFGNKPHKMEDGKRYEKSWIDLKYLFGS